MPTVTVQQAFQLAVQHHQAGRLAEAEGIYRQILAMEPQHADSLHLLGVVAGQTGRNELSAELIRRAIAVTAVNPAFHANLGLALSQQGEAEMAMSAYRRALELNPGYAEVHYNLANLLRDRGQTDEAIAAYRRCLECNPNYREAFNNMGNVLWQIGRVDDAIAAYRRALQLKPNHVEAQNNLGNALWSKGRLEESTALFRSAIRLKPDFAEAWNNLATSLKDQGLLDESIASCRRALEIQPDYAKVRSNLLVSLHYPADVDAEAIYREHCRWDERHARPLVKSIEPHGNDANPARCLRIGYVSPDFREHSVAFFISSLLESHDRAAVEVFCYADIRREDRVTSRLRPHAGTWREIAAMSDEEVARLVRKDRIDILVDLAGHTAENRLLVFARKPAPVQVTYLGYCDTTGMRAMDYRLTDAHADPPGIAEHLYTEKLFRLPETFACFRPEADSPAAGPLPAIARGYVTFGSFHTLAKLNDGALELWAQILNQVPGSRLMMVATGLDEASCRERIAGFFAKRGIGSGRLEFKARQRLAEYLALHREVDVLLDSQPFSGHTVSCHSLWMGVPIVTLAGMTHCSRMVMSVLTNAGLPEWVAQTGEEYVRIACAAAADVPRLTALRASLRERMAASPLTDAPRFARNVEDAYREMWRTWCSGHRA